MKRTPDRLRKREGSGIPRAVGALSAALVAIALCCAVPQGASAEDQGPSLQAGEALVAQDAGLEEQAVGDLQFMGISGTSVQNNTLYVRDGDTAYATITLKNTSNKTLEYVTMVNAPSYAEGANGLEPVAYGQDEDAFEPIIFPPYRTNDNEELATGATAMGDEWYTTETAYSRMSGYSIEAGATATFRLKVDAGNLPVGTYNWNIELGRIRYDSEWRIVVVDPTLSYWDSFFLGEEIEEMYSGQIPIKVVVYNQPDASLTAGENTGTEYAPIINLPDDGTLDFGTVDLATANDDDLTASRTVFAMNSSPENVMTDSHGNTTSIKVVFDGEAVEGQVGGWNYGPFSWGNGTLYDTNWTPLPPKVVEGNSTTIQTANYTVSLNATYLIAGTYTGNLIIHTTPHNVIFNGAAGNAAGEYRIPFKVDLTGMNPRLLPRATNLHAEPGNGQVELTWAPGEGADEHDEYTIYRREGAEDQTDPDKLDWNLYEEVGTAVIGTSDQVLFVDGSASNGTTYSYTVICGDPYHGYAAETAIATPDESIDSRLMAPEASCYGEVNSVEISWHMNSRYGGSSFDGAGMVDHFNIYRDGVLVDQVSQTAVIDTYNDYYNTHSYGWEIDEPVPELYTPYSWAVSAVSVSGVEGYLCDAGSDQACGEEQLILSHVAWFDSEWAYDEDMEDYIPAILLSIDTYGHGDCVETLTIWRSEGTVAPDTSGAPYATCNKDYTITSNHYDYVDTNVRAGDIYTYVVQGTDYDGVKTNYYTFTVKADEDETFETPDVEWSVIGGTTARLKWYGAYTYINNQLNYNGVYKVYRNDQLIQTVRDQDEFDVQNDPGADGTYVYRVDRVVSGIPDIRGREFTFVRNTRPVNPASLLQVPDAPTLSVRTATGTSNVILSWKPATTGGVPEGYHIYRKDAGEPVIGKYYLWNGWANWPHQWGMNRYLTIKDPNTMTLVDGYSGYYNGEMAQGELTRLNWDDEDLPHEYYITAYNRAGESAPSQVVVFDTHDEDQYGNAIAPANPVDALPAAPTIDNAWIEWDDSSSYQYGFDNWVSGNIHVAWEDSGLGGDIDLWTATFANTHNEQYGNPPETETLEFFRAMLDPAAKLGTSDNAPKCWVSCKPGEDGDLERTVTVTVAAENALGTATSNAVQVPVHSLPRFYALPGSGEAVLRWTDLMEGEAVQVTGWEVWRKTEYGIWERVAGPDDLPAPGEHSDIGEDSNHQAVGYYEWIDTAVDNGWTYQYKVVAKCDDGVDRPSVVRDVKPEWSAVTETPGAPQDLEYTIVNGEVQFSWSAPASGDAQYYYVGTPHQYSRDSHPWMYVMTSVQGPSTSLTWAPSEPGTYRCFVFSRNTINDKDEPRGLDPYEIDHDNWTEWTVDDYTAHLDELYPSHSNYIDVTITQEQIDERATQGTGSFTLTATPGDGQVQLSWTASPRATYYEVERWLRDTGYQDRSFPEVTLPVTASSYTDTTAEPGVNYTYRVTACNDVGGTYREANVRATGKTRDQIAAEQVEALIDSLPGAADAQPEDADRILQAMEVYQGLTDKQKRLISSERTQKLEEAAEAAELLQLQAIYGAEAAPVQESIDDLPDADGISLDDDTTLAAVADARAAYNALSLQARRLVDISKLEAAEAKIRDLQYEAEAAPVIATIAALPEADDVTLQNDEAVADARAAYDALSSGARAKVDVTKLEAAEAKINDLKYNLEHATVAVSGTWAIGADDGARPTVTVTMNGTTLTEGTDFRIAGYVAQGTDTMLDAVSAGGAYTVVVEGISPYFNQVQSGDTFGAYGDLATARIVSETSEYVYSGTNIVPSFSVFVNDVELQAGEDYSIVGGYERKDEETGTWESLGPIIPIDVGTYRVTLTGVNGGYYINSTSFEYSIAPATLTATYADEIIAHDGTPTYGITVTGFVNGETALTAADYNAPTLTAPTELVPGQSYQLTPEGGSARNYSFEYVGGTLFVQAENPDLTDAQISGVQTKVYDGTEQTQSPTVVMNGETLAEGTDYTLSYANNVDAGTATMTVTGIGCYTGEKSVNFTIDQAVSTIALANQTVTFTGAALGYSGALDRTGSSGDVSFAYYSDAACANEVGATAVVNAGTYYVTATLAGDTNHTPATSNPVTFTIVAKQATPTVALSAKSYVYNGKARKPGVTVKVGTVKLTTADYTVSYTGNVKVGKATATVKLKRNYAGTKAVSYTIVPKGTAISRLTAAAKGFTVKWKKQATQTTGYQVQYSLKSSFKSAKTVTVKGPKAVQKKIAKLKAKKKYFVRVRTYRAVGKTKYYSAWSKAKAIKTR